MSQTVRTLKKIASSEEYQALEAAIKELNADGIFNAYRRITAALAESEKEILERIQKLPRQNKDLDLQRFRATFAARSSTILPRWHWVNCELKKQKIMEGVVVAFGNKGDPLVKTPEGRVTVVKGAGLKEGDKVTFKVVAEGEKIDFGRVFELTPEAFYLFLTQDTRKRITDSLNSVRERLDNHSRNMKEDFLPELSQLLKELADARELASKLGSEEKERIISRIAVYRQRLLRESMVKLVFDFLSKREKREIEDVCHGDQQQIAAALSAPGIFCYQEHLSLKAGVLGGEKPKGYSDIVVELEKNLDSMKAAMQFMDFKTKMDEVYPSAKRYLENMDRFFGSLAGRATEVSLKLPPEACDIAQIQSAIEEAFSIQALGSELRRVFRSSREFLTLRAALNEVRARMGETQSTNAEAALAPYLHQVITYAFDRRS